MRAKVEYKFLDFQDTGTWISAKKDEVQLSEYVYIQLYDTETERYNAIALDKSTAIKFAKTLRTEINKIKS